MPSHQKCREGSEDAQKPSDHATHMPHHPHRCRVLCGKSCEYRVTDLLSQGLHKSKTPSFIF